MTFQMVFLFEIFGKNFIAVAVRNEKIEREYHDENVLLKADRASSKLNSISIWNKK